MSESGKQNTSNIRKFVFLKRFKGLKVRFWLSRILVYFPNRVVWHYKINKKKFFVNNTGLEIGGPSRQFKKIYMNCGKCDGVNFSDNTLWGDNEATYSFRGRKLGKLIIDDATELSRIKDKSYDFLLSSNNLEHIANPLKALEQFTRVTKPEGYILLLLPNKRFNFDHGREYTQFSHIVNDYNQGITEDDLTHMDEIVKKHDIDMDWYIKDKKKFIDRCKRNIENRGMHHHVFSEGVLVEMAHFFNLKVIDCWSGFCSDIIVLLQVPSK